MEKKRNFVKDIYIWLDGGRQKVCSVKCENSEIDKLLSLLENEYGKMFTYSEGYKSFYGEGNMEKSIKHCYSKTRKIIKKHQEDSEKDNKQE